MGRQISRIQKILWQAKTAAYRLSTPATINGRRKW
jgi:hypothetical protein